jgi:hypothetical protein
MGVTHKNYRVRGDKGKLPGKRQEVTVSMRNTRRSRGFLALAVLTLFVFVGTGLARELREVSLPEDGTDARPGLVWVLHNLGNVWSAFLNLGMYGDPWTNYPSMEWPGGSGSSYLWGGDFWTACYGENITTGGLGKYASCSDYGDWELSPSEGYPVEKLVPGPLALEQSQYAYDDWDPARNDPVDHYGIQVYQQNLNWGTPGYNNFIANIMVVTHHPQFGGGDPLDGLVVAVRGDCDVATANPVDIHLDDMVYYDGHAIWLSSGDPDVPDFEYIFQNGVTASQQDDYTYKQNADSPLEPDDPWNIWYHYNYMGSDGIPDNDVNGDGVSDQFTILFKYAAGDTLYPINAGTGMEMFTEGNRPENYWLHVVGDTTFAVVPRNMSYMWDSDSPGSSVDDSGDQHLDVPCVGFIGWRLLDLWVKLDDGTVERPVDVHGVPIPLSHAWWNWESDPGTDAERYDYMWGVFPDEDGQYSGPAYLENWVGNSNAPDARMAPNPGPWPFVYDNPMRLGYPVFDYRFLPSMGPVHLSEGDSLFVVGGWVVDAGLDGARRAADELLSAYYLDGGWGVPNLPPTPILFYEAQDNAVLCAVGRQCRKLHSPWRLQSVQSVVLPQQLAGDRHNNRARCVPLHRQHCQERFPLLLRGNRF